MRNENYIYIVHLLFLGIHVGSSEIDLDSGQFGIGFTLWDKSFIQKYNNINIYV